jgi:primosomal protein N' (replication factor Y) (superfamily II helicase)
MVFVQVYIEHPLQKLNRPFTYQYSGTVSLTKGMRVIVPFHQQRIVGFVHDVEPKTEQSIKKNNASFKILEIIEIVDEEPIINEELMLLVDYFSARYFLPKISLLQAILPKSLKPSTGGLKGPKIAYHEYLLPGANQDRTLLTAKQNEWLNLILSTHSIEKKDIKSKSILSKLVFSDYVRIQKVEKRRYKDNHIVSEKLHRLTEDQEHAVRQFTNSNDEIFLLEGVTGSGKTEVYIALAETYINQKKTVMIIVPEIALTPLMVHYFSKRFNDQVAILHSDLTDAEKYDEYRRIVQGKATIVVGARSAVFAPLNNIGLIVIDEEHVETYKQDQVPFYHAREVAMWRGHYHHAKVVLGSATPSLESKARADKGVYHHLRLPRRINEKKNPKMHIIDMGQTHNLYPKSSMFSHQLVKEIDEKLKAKEQTILLVNRRGYAASLICRSCRHIFKCPQCDIPLSFHQTQQSLKCHYCDYQIYTPKTCPDCQSPQLMKQGFGSERVEEEVSKLFPHARLLRLDSDIAKVRLNVTRVLSAFTNQEADILIGTQMIAKGHDFPNVTLVGVVLADLGLTLPHYRSSERTFQLISQAVGRTGRGSKDGLAIIQTYMPNHYAITTGSQQDFQKFYLQEMHQRKITQYPPYTYLALVELSSNQPTLLEDTSQQLSTLLHDQMREFASIIGPNIPYPEKKGLLYRRRILIKYKEFDKIHPIIKNIVDIFLIKSSVKFSINFDPYDI